MGSETTSILGRRLQRPVIDMGVSGSAKMEIELAELMVDLLEPVLNQVVAKSASDC